MIKEFEPIAQGVLNLIQEWEPRLLVLSKDIITVVVNFVLLITL
jgi:hypothetical protein